MSDEPTSLSTACAQETDKSMGFFKNTSEYVDLKRDMARVDETSTVREYLECCMTEE